MLGLPSPRRMPDVTPLSPELLRPVTSLARSLVTHKVAYR